MARGWLASMVVLVSACSEEAPPPRVDAAVAKPIDLGPAPAPPDLGPPPRLGFSVKGVAFPPKLVDKEQFRSESWKPKKGFKFLVVDAEVTFDRCDTKPLIEPHSKWGPPGNGGPMEKEVASCSLARRGDCVVNMFPFKGTKQEKTAAAAGGENSAMLSTATAFLVGGDSQRVVAVGGVADKKTCADCEMIVTARCTAARKPTLYSFVFNVPESYEVKAASFQLDGIPAPLASFAP